MAFHFKEHPAPKKTVLEDGTEVIRTCAWSPPGCHAVGCGIRLFVKDGEARVTTRRETYADLMARDL